MPTPSGGEEEWLSERMARHALPQSSHEQQLPGDRWTRIEERRTADGGSIGIRVDVTDLKRSEASFRLLFEENPLPMWVADANTGQLLAVNTAMCCHYGYPREELLAMSEHDLSGDGPSPAEPGRTLQEPIIHKTSRGDLIEVVIESRPLPYQGKAGRVSVAFDVTERNRAEQRVRYLASHDLLTELPNRAAFDARLATLMQHSGDAGGTFAVLCIDLDHFKEVNDLFGHSTGDAVLREASRRLRQAAQGAYVARVGGDEFIAIDRTGAVAGSRRTAGRPNARRRSARRSRSTDTRWTSTSASALRSSRAMATTLRSLLANADAALYRAKHEGRGTIRFFTRAMDRQLRDRRAMRARSAVRARERRTLPRLPAAASRLDGRIIGFEALVRWQHPLRGLVMPGRVHSVRRGKRADRADRRMGAAGSLPRGSAMGRNACRSPSTSRPVHFRRGESRAQVRIGAARQRAPAAPARARNHRRRADRGYLARAARP